MRISRIRPRSACSTALMRIFENQKPETSKERSTQKLTARTLAGTRGTRLALLAPRPVFWFLPSGFWFSSGGRIGPHRLLGSGGFGEELLENMDVIKRNPGNVMSDAAIGTGL